MNFASIEYIENLMLTKNFPYFSLFGPDGRSLLAESDEEGENSAPDAVNELRNALDSMEKGNICIIRISAYSKKQKAEGGRDKQKQFVFRIRVGGNNKAIAGTEAALSGATSARELELMKQVETLKLDAQKQAHEYALEKIRKEIEDIKSRDPLEKLYPFIGPMISGIMNKGAAPMAGASQAVNGPTGEAVVVEGTEKKAETPREKIAEAVKRLYKVDKNLPETLTTLADFAEKDPQKFLSFLPMLKNL